MPDCIICSKSFEKIAKNQKCCSDECSVINRQRYEQSAKRRLSRKIRLARYEQTERRKQYRKEYEATEKRKQLKKDYEKNPKRKLYHRIWEKGERRLKYKKEWLRGPTGKKLVWKRNNTRRSYKNNVIHLFSLEQFINKVIQTKGVCPGCNKSFDQGMHKLTLDHIFPISKANEEFKRTGIKRVYTIADVQPLCRSCNSSKKDKILEVQRLQ
jgi:predicted nucleic acid-binding Zn ribbon protein